MLILALSSVGLATTIVSSATLKASTSQMAKPSDANVLHWGDPVGGGGGGPGAPKVNATFVGSNLIYF
jgi:hypothetical protein